MASVCGEGEGRAQLRIFAENASLDVREDRYLQPFDARECRDVVVRPEPDATEVVIEARVRPEGGAPRARAGAVVPLARVPGVMCESAELYDVNGTLLLRAPRENGWSLLPALAGARLPPPAALRVVEVRAPPLAGVRLVNDGPGPAPLAAWRYPSVELLAPGASVFVPMDWARGDPRLPTIPSLRAGEMWTPEGVSRYGRTSVSAAPFRLNGTIVAYATPDAGAAPIVALIDSAREDVLVEAYTLTSPDVAAALARALDRGARVRVLLEGAPVGGVQLEQRALLSTLVARGAEVFALGGEAARYRTVHAKLVVVDRRAVSVATENLNEFRSRGFGLVVEDASLARRIGEVVEMDLAGHDVSPVRPSVPLGGAVPLVPSEPRAFVLRGEWNASLVLSPDEPLALARAIASARASVDVEMLRADPEGPMIDALVQAARRGARVRVLLDGRHDDGMNRETAARLSALATREGLALDARLDRPERTLHAKAFVVDGRLSYVGSMNWVRPALEDNREAGLLIESAQLAEWLEEEFEKDGWIESAGPRVEREVAAPPMGWMLGALLTPLLRPRTRSRVRGGG